MYSTVKNIWMLDTHLNDCMLIEVVIEVEAEDEVINCNALQLLFIQQQVS